MCHHTDMADPLSRLEFRPLREQEFSEAVELDSLAFAEKHTLDDVEALKKTFDFGRSYCAFESGRLVGISSALYLELTLPGERLLPVSGVTWVAVLPTHRRKGILTRLMRFQLEDAARRGEAGVVLIASEGSIYERFGLGPATSFLSLSVEKSHAGFRHDVDRGTGRLDLLTTAQAAQELPPLFDRVRRHQPGEVSRSGVAWQEHLRDAEQTRSGPMIHVCHRDDEGMLDGYVSYRVKEEWRGWLAANLVQVVELIASDQRAYARLWDYLLNLDLSRGVIYETGRMDEPLRWLLADPRAMQVQAMSDYLWLRLLDVPRALAARAYGARGDLVVEVQESFPLIKRSRLLLSVGEDSTKAHCTPTNRPAHMRLNVSALGTAYLGGASFAALAAAGRVLPMQSGAVELADNMFATGGAPYCSTMF